MQIIIKEQAKFNTPPNINRSFWGLFLQTTQPNW